MTEITLTRDEALEIVFESNDVVQKRVTDTGRWSIHYEVIFKLGDKLYRTNYSVGATEQQDEHPWEDEDTVKCVEVQAVTVPTIVYKEV